MKDAIIEEEGDIIAAPREAEVKPCKRLTVLGVEFVYLYMFGIIFAALGWIAENAAKIATTGTFDCRFHLLPFISPYALVPFALHIALGDPDDLAFFGKKIFKKQRKILSNLICLGLIMAFVFLGELAIGNMWEAVCGVKLWNYSNLPFQVTQYAGLIPTVGYGGGAYLIFRFVYKPLLKALRKIKFSAAKIICCTLGVAIVLDTAFMCLHNVLFNAPPMYWSVKLW